MRDILSRKGSIRGATTRAGAAVFVAVAMLVGCAPGGGEDAGTQAASGETEAQAPGVPDLNGVWQAIGLSLIHI